MYSTQYSIPICNKMNLNIKHLDFTGFGQLKINFELHWEKRLLGFYLLQVNKKVFHLVSFLVPCGVAWVLDWKQYNTR